MFLDRRRFQNFAFLFIGLICISIWQMLHFKPQQSQVPLPNNTVILRSAFTYSNTSYEYPKSTLPVGDYSRLIDLHEFKFLTLGKVCSNDTKVDLLVVVHTAPNNIQKRSVIRKTWATKREGLHMVFLLGAVEESIQLKLEDENRRFADMVQGNFVDHYRNMTYKHVMALKYAIYHCSQAKYILKTDDDVFVNMPTMMSFLNELPPNTNNLLLCRKFSKSLVARSFRSKWRVSFKEYRAKMYPEYCPGWALLYSADIVFTLYSKAQQTDYFWIDDVLITGTLFQNTNYTHTTVENAVISNDDFRKIMRHRKTIEEVRPFLFGPPDLSIMEISTLWLFFKNYVMKINVTAR